MQYPDGRVYIDSVTCAELIDKAEAKTGKLVPADPFDEATARSFFELFNSKVNANFFKIFKGDDASRPQAVADLMEGLKMLQSRLKGPFILGKGPLQCFGFLTL